MAAMCIMWLRARPDYERLVSIQDGFRLDTDQRYWIECRETEVNIYDIREDLGQMGTEVKIVFPMSHNVLTSVEEYVQ